VEGGGLLGEEATYPEDCILHLEARPFLPQDFSLDRQGRSQVRHYLTQ